MPVKLGNDRKNKWCVFQMTKLNDTQPRINVPYFERFDPSHMYYTSNTDMVGELKTEAEIKDEFHMDTGNTQYWQVLSYVHFLTNCVQEEILQGKKPGTVVLIGFNSGDSIPIIMEMFPMLDFVFVDDKVSNEKTKRMINALNPTSDQPTVSPSPLAGYFRSRAELKRHDFFNSEIDTRYRFVSMTNFMSELSKIPEDRTSDLRKRAGPFPLMEECDYPSSKNPPLSMSELVKLKNQNKHGLYLISNYRSSGHEARSNDNLLLLSDLVSKLYWMKILRPSYSLILYKPPTVNRGQPTEEEKGKFSFLTQLRPGDHVGSFCDYPKGYLLKIPKTYKSFDSAFLITNDYDNTMRIYHENFRTLINYHNKYTKRTVMYEDIFIRLIDDKIVGIPYSRLKENMIKKIIEDYKLTEKEIPLHPFYVTSSYDDTVAVYIIMSYLKFFGKVAALRDDTKMKELGMPVPSNTEKQVVKMNQVLKVIVHSLLVLRLEDTDYNKFINSFLSMSVKKAIPARSFI